jgi:hypothetical protein
MAHETGSPGAGRDPLDPKGKKTKGYKGTHRKGSPTVHPKWRPAKKDDKK